MSILTCEEIIKQGVRLAGVTYKSTDTKQLAWLKQWLRSVALSWPWPEVSAATVATLNANQYTLLLGIGGVAANAQHIQRVLFPISILYGESILPDNITQQAISSMIVAVAHVPPGKPDKAGYIPAGNGSVDVVFNRKTKTALTLQINFQYDPAAAYIISSVPWYANDNTLIQVIAFKQSEDSNGVTADTTLKLRDDLAVMLRDDKLKFGIIDQPNTKLNRSFSMT